MSPAAAEVGRHPFAFAVAVVKSFFRNQGLLLAGAIAYYALLSAVPLLILAVVVLSPLPATGELLEALSRYLEWAVPSQSWQSWLTSRACSTTGQPSARCSS